MPPLPPCSPFPLPPLFLHSGHPPPPLSFSRPRRRRAVLPSLSHSTKTTATRTPRKLLTKIALPSPSQLSSSLATSFVTHVVLGQFKTCVILQEGKKEMSLYEDLVAAWVPAKHEWLRKRPLGNELVDKLGKHQMYSYCACIYRLVLNIMLARSSIFTILKT
ncbi:hypothetical protein Droror1_Dr00009455 [Drosera rotundifolia]